MMRSKQSAPIGSGANMAGAAADWEPEGRATTESGDLKNWWCIRSVIGGARMEIPRNSLVAYFAQWRSLHFGFSPPSTGGWGADFSMFAGPKSRLAAAELYDLKLTKSAWILWSRTLIDVGALRFSVSSSPTFQRPRRQCAGSRAVGAPDADTRPDLGA